MSTEYHEDRTAPKLRNYKKSHLYVEILKKKKKGGGVNPYSTYA